MNPPSARNVAAVLLTATICAAILAPIGARIWHGPEARDLPETVVASLTDLLKVAIGAVVGWLASAETKT